MSSNTLRGIGQEGEGEGGDASAPPPQSRDADESGSAPVDRTTEGDPRTDSNSHSGVAAGPSPEIRQARALDAPVPGTQSLDASVPDAQPSLDAKIPALAATLMGVAPPSISAAAGGRDKGTVQGRDIHLPVEAQRVASVHPIAGIVIGESGATPELIDRSEPTLADPIRTAAIAQATAENASSHNTDLNSHSPWYDQEPVGAHVYEEEKPSLVGRAAIGVAVAAGISVVLFAIVRLYAQNGASDEPETPRSPLSYKSAPAPPVPTPASSAQPLPEPTRATAQPSTVGEAHAIANPLAPATVDRPETSAFQGTRLTVPPRTRPPARLGVPPQTTGSTSHAQTTTRLGGPARLPPLSNAPSIAATTPPPIMPPPQMGNATSAMPRSLGEPPAPSAPTKATAPRARPIYDPDSTLPLNVE